MYLIQFPFYSVSCSLIRVDYFYFLHSFIFSVLETAQKACNYFFMYLKYIFWRSVYCVVSSRIHVIEGMFELKGLWIAQNWELIFVSGVPRWLCLNFFFFLLVNNGTIFYMYQPRIGQWIKHANKFTFLQRKSVRLTLFKRTWSLVSVDEQYH